MSANKIWIAGGGIGGLTCAIALSQRGFDVEVLERSPELRAAGAGITIQTNAMIVMQKLGLADALTREGHALVGGRVIDSTGATLQKLEFDEGPPGVAIHRERLLRVLAEANAAPVRLGAHVVSYEQSADEVRVELADGTRLRGAALIACDGLHSDVRKTLLGDRNDDLVYAGYTTWRGVCRDVEIDELGTCEIWGAGERFGIVPIGHGEVYWFAVADALSGGSDGALPTEELLQRFAGWPSPVEQLLRQTPDDGVIRTDTFDRDPIDTWVEGRIALLGDAAHPMTPNLGQGAGQAIEDALAVANAMDGHREDVAAALRAYQSSRRERANWFVVQSRRMGQIAQLSNPIARALRNAGLRLTPDSVTRRSVRKMYEPQVEVR